MDLVDCRGTHGLPCTFQKVGFVVNHEPGLFDVHINSILSLAG